MAIVGMDVILAGVDGLDAFEYAIYEGFQKNSFGADLALSLADVDLTSWGDPGRDVKDLSEEDRLLLKVMGRALRDAASPGGIKAERIALLYSRGSQLAAQTGGNPANGEPIPGNFAGQALDLSGAGNPLAVGLEQAYSLLDSGVADMVLLAGVTLAKDFAGLLQGEAGKLNHGPHTLGFDRQVEGWTTGEGAAALVLMRYDEALEEEHCIYATINSFARVLKDLREPKKYIFPTYLSSETILQSCQQAFEAGGVDPARIGYLEVLGSGFAPIDAAEIGGLTRAYRHENADLTCAMGSVQTNTGYLMNAAGVTALVKAALCLYHRLIPATPQWSGPKKAELWQDTPFYVAVESRTWVLPAGETTRTAALNSIGWDGSCMHLILAEDVTRQHRSNKFLAQSPFYLFPIAGDQATELLESLNELKQNLAASESLSLEARKNFESYRLKEQAKYAAVVVGSTREEILKEIDYIAKDFLAGFEQKKTWQTPQGSFFTTEPVGKEGNVAFVYPGAFNSYIGLGQELFFLFPHLYARVTALTSNLGATLRERQLYPRCLEALTKEELATLEAQLNADPIAMITSGSLMAVLFTMILRDVFKLHPSSAFGYSLGEICMLFGTGVWSEADEIRTKLEQSSLFRTRLSGPQNAVRECWGLPPALAKDMENALWTNYFLMAPVEKVVEAVKSQSKVYLTHVNTPRQVVIGGDPHACQQVIASLKCTSLKAPFDFALHTEAIRSEWDAFTELNTWHVAEKTDICLYTAADDQPMPMDSRGIADRLSEMLCSRLDFPALVNQVYANGARVFIELGANANCSKWIDDTLKGRPYAAVAINRRGADDHASIVRMLAKLVSQRVPLDLSPLYQ